MTTPEKPARSFNHAEIVEKISLASEAINLRKIAMLIVNDIFDAHAQSLILKHFSTDQLSSSPKIQPQELRRSTRNQLSENLESQVLAQDEMEEANSLSQLPSSTKSMFMLMFRSELSILLDAEIFDHTLISDEQLYRNFIYPLYLAQLRRGIRG